MSRVRLFQFALILAAAPASAQQPSPYTGMTDRAIKALSAEQVRQLETGEGMGFALAAELNRYPGPRHVLDLADSLRLSPEQRAAITEAQGRMSARARALGAELVARERELDALFASGAADSTTVRTLTAEIGRLTGELRYAHLAAHVTVTGVLSAKQRHDYQRLRGYAGHEH